MKKKKLKKLLKEEKQKVKFLSNKVDQLTKDINYYIQHEQELRLKERGYAPTVTELVSQTYEDPAISALINQAKETNSVLTPQAENFMI